MPGLPAGPAIILVAGGVYVLSLLVRPAGRAAACALVPAPPSRSLRSQLLDDTACVSADLTGAISGAASPCRAGALRAPSRGRSPCRSSRASRSSATSCAQVGGDRVAVTALVGPNGDAHVYQPSPADAKTLAGAKLVVVNGLGFEGWIDAAGQGLRHEGAGRRRGARREAAEAWRRPRPRPRPRPRRRRSARLAVRRQRQDLRRQHPRCAGRGRPGRQAQPTRRMPTAYLAAARRARRRGPAPRSRASRPTGASAITTHDAFGYFAAAYGIAFIAPQGVSTEAEASAKDVARIIRQIRAREDPGRVPRERHRSAPDRADRPARRGAKIGGRLYSDALSGAGRPGGDLHRHDANTI